MNSQIGLSGIPPNHPSELPPPEEIIMKVSPTPNPKDYWNRRAPQEEHHPQEMAHTDYTKERKDNMAIMQPHLIDNMGKLNNSGIRSYFTESLEPTANHRSVFHKERATIPEN